MNIRYIMIVDVVYVLIIFFIEYSKKEKEILDILLSNDVDIERLRSFVVSLGGLLNDDIRKEVWLRLFDVDVIDILKKFRK